MKHVNIVLLVLAVAMILSAVFLLYVGSVRFDSSLICGGAEISASPLQSWSAPRLFADCSGTTYEWSDHALKRLGDGTALEKSPSSVFPAYDGIGFVDNGCLYRWTSGGVERIAENVSAACWDEESFLWLDRDLRVVSGTANGEKLQLLSVDEGQLGEPMILLASENWIVLGAYRNGNFFQDTFVYDRRKKTGTSVSLYLDGSDFAFLCDDKLIKIGGSQDTFCSLDLNTLEKTNYDASLTADQGTITASAAYDRTKGIVFVSVYSKPERPEFYETNAATFAVDLQNRSISKIDDHYYPGLAVSYGCVYGVKKGLLGAWRTVLLAEGT